MSLLGQTPTQNGGIILVLNEIIEIKNMKKKSECVMKCSLEYATLAHSEINHTRKYTGEDYIHHPIAVADIVRTVEHTPEMVAAAHLHDVVEDTIRTMEDIREVFSETVSNYVEFLTNPSKEFPELSRKVRKEMDRLSLAEAPADVHTIKVADLIHNSVSIIEHDKHFAKLFVVEMEALLDTLVGADEILMKRARDIVKKYYSS